MSKLVEITVAIMVRDSFRSLALVPKQPEEASHLENDSKLVIEKQSKRILASCHGFLRLGFNEKFFCSHSTVYVVFPCSFLSRGGLSTGNFFVSLFCSLSRLARQKTHSLFCSPRLIGKRRSHKILNHTTYYLHHNDHHQ